MGIWLWLLAIHYMAIGNWLFASGYGYGYWLWVLVIGYEYITMVIDYMDRVTIGL
jgi:hypothetical protein